VHASSIVAGFGKVIPPDLVALIVEDFVADQTRQYIQLRMRDVFRRKASVLIGWRRAVAGSDDNVGWDCHLPKPGLVHAEPLDIAGSHREGCPDPIVAHVVGGFGIDLHLLPDISRHPLVVLPNALAAQETVGLHPGTAST